MNSQNLRDSICSKKPRYNAVYKPLMEIISTKGDASGNGDFSTFGAFYQTYMYAYIIGLRLGKKTIKKNAFSHKKILKFVSFSKKYL